MNRPTTPPIILGTSSPYRQSLFRQHFPHLPFTILHPSIDEKAITAGYADRSQADPSALTLAVAHAKSKALLSQLPPNAILITSDQVVSYENHIREKPTSKQQAIDYLQSYATHPLITVTAIVIHSPKGTYSGVDIAKQHLKPLPPDLITQIVEAEKVMTCSGGIAIEDKTLQPYLLHRQGEWESILGLPIALTTHLLSKSGISAATL